MLSRSSITAALHAKDRKTVHASASVHSVPFIGSSYAIYRLEHLTKNKPSDYSLPETSNAGDAMNAKLEEYAAKATKEVDNKPKLFALSMGELCARLAADLYVNEKYLELVRGFRLFVDPNLKGTPIVAKDGDQIMAFIMPVSIQDADHGIKQA